ncbi:laminarinase [Fulvivirga imtechensis AK7]|uniref:Laminarinase n=1 Tax=Fulvivirga imtechensis AK7 TaxID=1237149 RepID=L8JQR6_9BACT|nr:glycoside hydrolase family 16 protein [Fulvivirga imtechensis]ELR70568.1 laminarinase [Fulvivirga imtechensis AK7]
MKKSLIAVLLFLFASACGEDKPTEELVPPSNLVVTVEANNEGSGLVTFHASADNTNYYSYYFGEGNGGDEPIISNDGKAAFTYSVSGTYVVTVQAHATAEVFVSVEKEVVVEVEEKSDDIPATGYTTPESYEGMDLVWQDEFNGSGISSDWTFEIGTGSNGWGNNELQYYRQENTEVRDGYLIITAKKESFQGQEYTSSRIITKDKQTFQYGRIDIRAALPKGKGIWPALWMLGSDFSTVGWPACGEIDIMEMIGGTGKDNTVHGTVHWQNAGEYASYGGHYTLSSGILADEFHVFTIIWDASSITWYIDDIKYHEIDITPAELSEFRNDFFFIFNVAVGGNWPGSPDDSTTFPQRMVVDYVRVFQDQ